jgi:Xaa-Pro aminopeptidase
MDERVLFPISDAELERRWSALRAIMSERAVSALVVQNNNDWLGGYVKWLTDLPPTNGYPTTVIFHLDDLMTVIEMGPKGGYRALHGDDQIYRGVGLVATTPAFTSVAFTDRYQSTLVLEDLKPRSYSRIGVAGFGALPHRFIRHIESELEPIPLIDLTEEVDWIKSIKSPEEVLAIRKCAAMQDEIFSRVMEKIRPGMRDTEVTALAQYEGRLLGSEQGLFLGSSAPLEKPSRFLDRHQQGRTIEPGDHFTLLIENSGPGGYYTEIARTIVFGRPNQQLTEGFAAMRAAQAHTLSLIRPRASCREIAAAHDDYLRTNGFPTELRLYSHGQGYDLVERPLIRADESMTLAEGMNLAVHPGYELNSNIRRHLR